MGLGGAIVHPLHTFCAEPLHPFGDGLGRGVELVGRVGLAQPTFHHASGHRLSTFRRQRRILVDVHLVSPWNTEASQPQLPRFRPDGQPPERPKLGYGYGYDGYYGDNYAYNDDSYAYNDGYYDTGSPGYVVSGNDDPTSCAQRYRSYDPGSGTY